jgi:hypothetical protein
MPAHTKRDRNRLYSGVHRRSPKIIVIPKRGIIARGICFFAAGSQQIPRRYTWLRNDKGVELLLRKLQEYPPTPVPLPRPREIACPALLKI